MYHFIHSFSARLLLGAFLVFGGASVHAQETEVKRYVSVGYGLGDFSDDKTSDSSRCQSRDFTCDQAAGLNFSIGFEITERFGTGFELGYVTAGEIIKYTGNIYNEGSADFSTIYLTLNSILPINDYLGLMARVGGHWYSIDEVGSREASSSELDVVAGFGLNIDYTEKARLQLAWTRYRLNFPYDEIYDSVETRLVYMF